MGMSSEIISVNSRKPIFGYMAMVGSLFAIAILAFLVWAHHMFVTGLESIPGFCVCITNVVDRGSISY
jgi:cytochrome c oxidase subunit 1